MAESTEREFLAGYDAAAFARPSVAVDVVLLTVDDAIRTLVLRRSEHPERHAWALPGGFVGIDEPLDATAQRVLHAKAQLTGIYLEQLYTFGAPRRDPRTRIISVAYFALVPPGVLTDGGERDRRLATVRVPWSGESGGPVALLGEDGRPLDVAFDHGDMIGMAVKRLRGKLAYTPIGYSLLPERFTLLQLQRIHEIINGANVNKDSFRRRMLASGELEDTGAMQAGVGHRPAALYRFAPGKHEHHG